ncbi:MAG: threonylcarbamoyl-AMP synthase [Myxococcaceae bacterium]|nr:threonylcarbamoyl-AMP synthase [Myxococcaceae bacterium]MCI0669060.1 threonylcarbamoyl-AMP synthase [Myxococcaceae bacterium]
MSSAPILTLHPEHPAPRLVQRAVDVLASGGLVAYPTDTSYALGCDLHARRSIERLYQLKRRDVRKPLSVLVPDLGDVARYAMVSNFAYRILRRHTPGPFTFVLPATRLVPDIMMTRQKQVGIRVPDAALARALAAGLGRPLATTSATNPEGGELLLDARDIKDTLGHGLELILDGGVVPAEPGTIVSLVGDVVEVLRQGKGDLGGL